MPQSGGGMPQAGGGMPQVPQAAGGMPQAAGGMPQAGSGMPQVPQAVGGSILETIKQHGVDPSRYGVADEAALVRVVTGLFSNWDRINEAIMLAEAVAPHLDKIRPIITGQSSQPPQAPQPQPVQSSQIQPPQPQPPQPQLDEYWKKPPEWRDEWAQYLVVDAQGNVRAASPLYEKYAEAYRMRQAWEREAADKLLSDPVGLILQAPQFAQTVEKIIQAEFERRRSKENIQKIIASNADKFFQMDANGNPMVNPVTGEPVLTQVGRFAQEFLRWATDGDYEAILPIAVQIGELLARQQTPPSSPSPSPQPSPPPQSGMTPQPPAQQPSPTAPVNPGAERRFGQRGAGQSASPAKPSSAVNFRELLYRNAQQFGVTL